jgi:hypothetical protein
MILFITTAVKTLDPTTTLMAVKCHWMKGKVACLLDNGVVHIS